MKLNTLFENSTSHVVTGQFFKDLKLIYQAHTNGVEPNHLVLSRATEVMIRFMRSEVKRTRKMQVHFKASDGFSKMLKNYEAELARLIQAKAANDYKMMYIAIDQCISLTHWYGSVWDNLVLSAKYSKKLGGYKRDPQVDAVYDDLTDFMQTIGRFMKPPPDWVKQFLAAPDPKEYMKNIRATAWHFDAQGKIL